MNELTTFQDMFTLRDHYRMNNKVAVFSVPDAVEPNSELLGVLALNFTMKNHTVKVFDGKQLMQEIKKTAPIQGSASKDHLPICIIKNMEAVNAKIIKDIDNHLKRNYVRGFNSLIFLTHGKLPTRQTDNYQLIDNVFQCLRGPYQNYTFITGVKT